MQIGIPYVLLNEQNGAACVFNTVASNYVGDLLEISGLDSPEVFESFDRVPGGDGGVHGDFFYGRRIVTLNVQVTATASDEERMARLNLLRKVSDNLRGDGFVTLEWMPTEVDLIPRKVFEMRLQQPMRVTGGRIKNVFLSFVTPKPYILASALTTPAIITNGGSFVVANRGTGGAEPYFEIRSNGTTVGAGTHIITNNTTGEYLKLTPGSIASGAANYVKIGTARPDRYVIQNDVLTYDYLVYPESTPFTMLDGDVISYSAPANAQLYTSYRETWV